MQKNPKNQIRKIVKFNKDKYLFIIFINREDIF